MILRAGQYEFTFPGRTLLMGVVNVTPDSFSDGGNHFATTAAVEHGLKLIEQGADMLDIGGESTRPKAVPVSEAEELRRVLPVLEGLAGRVKVPLSIDTMKPRVARAALKAGASLVNDVAANREDPEMWETIAETKAAYIVMHMQGTPQTMQERPAYKDVVAEVKSFFEERLGRLARFGLGPERLVLDVGIGFGKTVEHNLQLLNALQSFTNLKCPLLLGVSRKSFLDKVTGAKGVTERLPGSLACACWGVEAGVNLVRTHDVSETRQALRMAEAILATQRTAS